MEKQLHGKAGTPVPVNEPPDILGGFNTHRIMWLSPSKPSTPEPTGETFGDSRVSKPNRPMQMASDLLTDYEYRCWKIAHTLLKEHSGNKHEIYASN